MNKVITFVGRFQPPHRGHYSVYQYLCKEFDKNCVYIGTSNKIESPNSPFSFKEKKIILTSIFKILQNKIIQVKSPYAPKEILSKFDANNTSFITVLSEKDSQRLKSGKYYREYKGVNDIPYKEGGYYIVAPELKFDIEGTNISGTEIRKLFSSDKFDRSTKIRIFKKIYPIYNEDIFNLLISKLEKPIKEESPAIMTGDGEGYYGHRKKQLIKRT